MRIYPPDAGTAVELMEKAWRGTGRFFYQIMYIQMKNRLEKRLGESS